VIAVALSLLAAPAHAQKAAPVKGGGSFNDAPLVEPGTYKDTILPGEQLYYAFTIAEGQQAKVAVALKKEPGIDFSPGTTRLEARLFGANRAEVDWDWAQGFIAERTRTLSIKSETVGDSSNEALAVGGTFFVAVKLFRQGLPRKEYDTRISIELLGTAVEPSPSPSPSPSASASPSESPSPEDGEGTGGGTAAGPTDPGSSDALPVRAYLISFLAAFGVAFAVQLWRGARRRFS
jgi:Ca-activated chloride channel homolog